MLEVTKKIAARTRANLLNGGTYPDVMCSGDGDPVQIDPMRISELISQ